MPTLRPSLPPRARVALALSVGFAAALAAPRARAQDPAPPAPWVYEPEGDIAAPPLPSQPYAPPGATPPATVFALGYDPALPPPPTRYAPSPARQSLIVLGGITFGLSYVVTAAVGASMNAEKSGDGNTLFVPVVGPFLQAVKTDDEGARQLLSIACSAQLLGAASLVAGLAMPTTVRVSNNLARVRLAPMPLGRAGGGLALVGTF